MPLASYGVLIGAFDHFGPPQQGKWYHGVIYLAAPPGIYQCAVDVATKSTIRVQYRVLHELDTTLFAPLLDLPAGYHDLAPSPASGALDYVRSPLLASGEPWIDSDGDNAIAALQGEVAQGARVFIFGEPYNVGLGQHNIHMNQGDPPLSPDGRDHQGDDGIWQDGGTILQRADQSLHAVLTKFSTQSLCTDDNGLPI